MKQKKDCPPAGSQSGSLRKMFQFVSPKYDVMNLILTFGMDQRWRKEATRSCLEDSPQTILDLCCGTGDLLFSMLKQAPNGTVVLGVDFSEDMVERAGLRAGKAEILVIADVGHLPFKSGSFDCVATAFSFRNLLYKNPGFDGYLNEIIRILKRGGNLVVLETSQPEQKALRKVYHGYLRTVVPFIGGSVSGNKGAYTYLSKSALNFPAQREISAVLREAGFSKVTFRPLFLGIVGIHTAMK